MSRHSKNNTAHSIFTYHERKLMKDVGTLKERLGGESQKRFEDCWLCLSTALKPVCSPRGFIFCRSCIVLNFAQQKNKFDLADKTWNATQQEKLKEEDKLRMAEKDKIIKDFKQTEGFTSQADNNMPSEPGKTQLRAKNFWIAENTPAAEMPQPKGPPKRVTECPISGDRLRLKDLIDVRPEEESSNETNKNELRWICAVSKRAITHQSVVLIKRTGQLVLKEYVDKYVFGKRGFCGNCDVKPSDIVPVIPGGTGFCAHNKVEAERFRPVCR
eukprot:GHVQ01027014.1.p1 GENE.GHVQ01027014.1~~GHVQ01027014.1.p1  ORF type:complete len:272 (-),score=37.72 GHVQ01027014.1:383-1198(-)